MPDSPAGVRAQVRAWLEANWSRDLTLREWWRRLADSGWAFPAWPEQHFGRGLSVPDAAEVSVEIQDFGAPSAPGTGGQRLAGPTVIQHGTEEQKRRFLPLLARGEEAWCQLFSEPGAGSDLASLSTRAVRDGDGWRIDGHKIWSSGALASDRGFLLARTGSAGERHRGLSYFIVDFDQPGITVLPLKQMTGETAFGQVILDGARVGQADLIGEAGGGWTVALTTLGVERFASVSSTRDGFHWSMSPTGVPGRRSTTLDMRVADLLDTAARTEAARSDGDDVARRLAAAARDTGQWESDAHKEEVARLYLSEQVLKCALAHPVGSRGDVAGSPAWGSVRKLLRSELMAAARDLAVKTGSAGLALGAPAGTGQRRRLESLILSSPLYSIAGGTDEIQRNIIGERLLGLPRDERPS